MVYEQWGHITLKKFKEKLNSWKYIKEPNYYQIKLSPKNEETAEPAANGFWRLNFENFKKLNLLFLFRKAACSQAYHGTGDKKVSSLQTEQKRVYVWGMSWASGGKKLIIW